MTVTLEGPYPVEIDPDLGPWEMTRNYDIGEMSGKWSERKDLDGNRLTPLSRNEEKELMLLPLRACFDEDACPTIETVLEKLSQLRLTPETVLELLAFGKKYPDIQRDFPIVQLGSVYHHVYIDRLSIAALWKIENNRSLVGPWHDQWILPDCRILVSHQ